VRLLASSFDVFSQGWIRAAIIALFLLPITLYKKEIRPLSSKDWNWFAVFFITSCFTQAPMYYAFNHMDIGTATLLLFVSLLITMYIVGFLIFKEKMTTEKSLALIIAIIGLFLIFSFSLEKFSLFPGLMAMMVGVASGLQISFSKKLSSKYSTLYLSLISWLIVIPIHILGSFLFTSFHMPAFTSFLWLILIGYALAGLFSYWFYLTGMKYVEATTGGLIGLMEIIFSIGFGMLLFGEILTLRVAIGAVLVLAAAALPDIRNLLTNTSRNK
jgi:drug/metabolite transporter (DMT)-like permease